MNVSEKRIRYACAPDNFPLGRGGRKGPRGSNRGNFQRSVDLAGSLEIERDRDALALRKRSYQLQEHQMASALCQNQLAVRWNRQSILRGSHPHDATFF